MSSTSSEIHERSNFEELQGDLFIASPPTNSLAHCISADLKMERGIAVLFKSKFGGVSELQEQSKRVGEVAYLVRDGKYIFYLITKEEYFHKPTHEDFERAVSDLRRLCDELGVSGLSMPRIGAGLDKLDLDYVKSVVRNAFDGSNTKVTMFYL
ncbi:11385_t:CDS:1 [Paraglomus occultum]|uniref:ADP-ribose 1''-phosphate phosphatase n=1 Tax=Paraglomus occultum TaxID=144539 RepID=A0A9N9G8E8_9GLOM|nr:11385_t:CDS:1 [Paraglomus occultum]